MFMRPPLAAVFLFLAFPLGAQNAGAGAAFPSIERLDIRDPVFKQYVQSVDLARRLIFSREASPSTLADNLRIFSYDLGEQDDLYTLAARCNIPYASLVTLNRLGHPTPLPKTMLLPTVPGIFIPESPKEDLEQLIAAGRDSGGAVIITVNKGAGQAASQAAASESGQGAASESGQAASSERFLFLPGEDFSPTERTYFLNTGFKFPLRNYRITSSFGYRPSPFTGRLQNHQGLDLAAPAGTAVYAALEGTVAETGRDAVYGNYIIVSHRDNWVSLYGHLQAIDVAKNAAVRKDTVIGRVGSTGQSTGPHLHFEIRKNGRALDPGKLLFKSPG
jgi:murein DD-endopeptidase MepM/ murein hydrolase activator NlpD